MKSYSRSKCYNEIKLANNGYTKVYPHMERAVKKLIELKKIVYIAPNYVALPENETIARKMMINPE